MRRFDCEASRTSHRTSGSLSMLLASFASLHTHGLVSVGQSLVRKAFSVKWSTAEPLCNMKTNNSLVNKQKIK